MTNKTITLARELAQETATLIIRDICEYEPDDNPDSLCITVKALELILLQRLEDASTVLADPVPPAGGEPDIYAWVWSEILCGEEVNDGISFGPDKPEFKPHLGTTFEYAPVYTQHVVTRLQAEVSHHKTKRLRATQLAILKSQEMKAYRAEVGNLRDQRDALKAEVELWKGRTTNICRARADLQSELTKARELIADMVKQQVEAGTDYTADVGRAKAYLSNQSAPADKGQGEPVARVRHSPVRKRLSVELLRSHMKDGDLLYAEQPAPVAVVLPERMPVPVYQIAPLAAESAIGWNNCLKEVARLNPAHLENSAPVQVLAEAREWLGDGKHADGLAREHWTPEYAALIDRIDATLSK